MKQPQFITTLTNTITNFIDRYYHKLKPENVVLVLGLIFGLCFTLLTPPLMVNDEQAHYWRAYKLSEGDIVPSQKEGEIVGEELPQSVINLFEVYYRLGKREKPEDDFNISDTLHYLKQPLHPEEKGFIGMMNTISYTPIPYIPQTVGIFVGRMLSLSPFSILLLGRIANLLFTLFCVYLAVKITPVLKWGFVLLTLMPTILGQISSASADGMTISMSFLFIALVFKAAFSKDFIMNKRWIAGVFISGVLLALSKQAYIVLPLLIILVPRKKFNSLKNYSIFLILFLLMTFVPSMAWNMNISPAAYTPGEQALIDANKEYIMSNPIQSIFVVFYDIYLRNSEMYVETLVGRLGWMQIPMSFIFHILPYLFVLILLALIEKNEQIKVSIISKLMMFAIAATNIFLIGFALYTLWTKGTHNVVEGLQGRYYVPLIPLLLLCLWNKSFYFKPQFRYPKVYLVLGLICSSLLALAHIFAFFYLDGSIF